MARVGVVITLVLVAACAEPVRAPRSPPVVPSLASLRLVSHPSFLPSGEFKKVGVIGTYSDQTEADLTHHVTWESSDTSVLAIPNPGLLVARAQGTAQFTARLGIVTTSAELLVTDATLEGLTMYPAEVQVPAGIGQWFKVLGRFSDGVTRDVTRDATWSTDDTETASVVEGQPGLIQSHRPGMMGVTARVNEHAVYSMLEVTDASLQELVISGAYTELDAGNTIGMLAEGRFSDGQTRDLTTQVQWSVSDDTKASISGAGVLTGWMGGEVVVMAELQGVLGHTSMNVVGIALSEILITLGTSTLAKGESTPVHAIGRYIDGSLRDITGEVTWYTSDLLIADPLSVPGLVRTFAEGQASIHAERDHHTAQVALKVAAPKMTGLEVDIGDTRMTVSTQLQLTAFGRYTDGTVVELTDHVQWTSGNSSLAGVSNDPGAEGQVAAGVNPGQVTIQASYDTFVANSVLEVTDATLLSVLVQQVAGPMGGAGQRRVEAIGTYSDNVVYDLTPRANWSSSDTNVVTVSNAPGSRGSLEVIGSGHVDVSATVDGITGTVNLIITP